MSEAKKYDRSYKEQSVKPALEIGVQAAKKGIYTDTTKKRSPR